MLSNSSCSRGDVGSSNCAVDETAGGAGAKGRNAERRVEMDGGAGGRGGAGAHDGFDVVRRAL